jgi:hypothetical protein
MLTLLYFLAVIAAMRGLWSPCGLSMLSSLNPVAETARGNRFWLTACWYVAGALAGGALLGGGCALVAWAVRRVGLPTAALWSIVLVAAVVATASDARLGGWTLPLHPRQVDERWLTKYRRWIYASGYGVQIGTGFATYIMTAAVYLTAVLAVATASPLAALAAGLTFGGVRGLAIVVAGSARTAAALRSLLGRVDALSGTSALVAALTSASAAGVAAAELGGVPLAAAVATVLAALLGVRARPVLAG